MRIAVVTGSNKGVGNGIVELLAKHFDSSEWHIYLTARNVKLGEEAVMKFKEQNLSVKFHQLDITNKESRRKLVDFIKKEYPDGLNILINNAGIYKPDSSAPSGEQAKVTVETNYTATVDMCLDFLPVMAKNSNVFAKQTFDAMSEEMAKKFMNAKTLKEVDDLIAKFVKLAEAGDQKKEGFANSAYGMSKVGLCKVTEILAEQYKSDPRHILINSVSPAHVTHLVNRYVSTDLNDHKGVKTILEGADTPFYLATLPDDAAEPYGEFISERKVVKIDAKYR